MVHTIVILHSSVEIIFLKFSKGRNLQRCILLLIDTPCKHINFYWYQCIYSLWLHVTVFPNSFNYCNVQHSSNSQVSIRDTCKEGKVSFQMKRSLSLKKSWKKWKIKLCLFDKNHLPKCTRWEITSKCFATNGLAI